MSLVNKMLQDLEARQPPRPVPPAYQGLRAARGAGRGRRLLLGLAGLLALALGALVYGERFGLRLEPLMALAVSGFEVPPAPPRAPAGTQAGAPARPDPVSGPAVPVAAAAEPAPTPPAVAEPLPAAPVAAPADSPGPRPAAIVAAKAAPSPAPDVRVVTKPAPKPAARPASKPRAASQRQDAGAAPVSAAIEKTARPLAPAEQAQAAYLRGVQMFEQGRAPQAMEALRAALTADPAHVKARELAAAIALQNGRRHEAQRLLEEGLRQVPKQHLFARMLARVYIDQGAEAKALAVLEGAAPAESDDADFSGLLGLLYQRAGRHADAVKAYERALVHGDEGRLWLGLAISLEGTEQPAAAKEAYRRARERGLEPLLARYAEQRLTALD